jgi:hypothetical protein
LEACGIRTRLAGPAWIVGRGHVDVFNEFGAAGEEEIPVRYLLSHQAGLPVIDPPLTFEDACAWHPVIRALEAQKPLWLPGHRAAGCTTRTPSASWNTAEPRASRLAAAVRGCLG